ncbi:hypothetical protein LINGRAHAP2_LOCUS31323 [Linum grandiflorum]
MEKSISLNQRKKSGILIFSFENHVDDVEAAAPDNPKSRQPHLYAAGRLLGAREEYNEDLERVNRRKNMKKG